MSVFKNSKYIKILISFLIVCIAVQMTHAIDNVSVNTAAVPRNESSSQYYNLLNKLAKYQTLSAENMQSTVNEFLKYYGYPENLVKINFSSISQDRAKFHNSSIG